MHSVATGSGISVHRTMEMPAKSEQDACVRLDREKGEVPDCVDPSLTGEVYACDSPPTDNPNILCFQPDDDPSCDPEQINSETALDGKSWVCIDRTSTAWKEGDDSY